MALFTLKGVKYQNILSYEEIEIIEGGATFICGDSGTGKSTLLKLLNGVISPSSGELTYLDQPIESYDPISLRRDVLLVSQSVYLFDLSIRDNFKEFYDYRDQVVISDEEMKYYLNLCSIDVDLDTMSYNLSGGQRQRVFIAINLSFQSKVLMLDEPTSALDEKNGKALMNNIKALCEQKEQTLLVVSHDLQLVEAFADRRITLGGGFA